MNKNIELVDGDHRINNASKSWNYASKLDTFKIEESLAQYKNVANVQGSKCDNHINIVRHYYYCWKVNSGYIINSLVL